MSLEWSLIFWVAVVIGLAYGLMVGREPGLPRAIFKTAPLALLAVAAWLADAPWLLVLAFALSAAGDWFLAFRGEKFFLAGLSAFLLAHLAYARLFFLGQNPAWSSGPIFLAGAVIVFAVSIGVFRVLRPRLDRMKWPVAVYTAVIAAMAVAALGRGPDAVLLAGVALFMASDIALAFETFPPKERAPSTGSPSAGSARVRWRPWFVWYAYFLGQVLIGLAYLLGF